MRVLILVVLPQGRWRRGEAQVGNRSGLDWKPVGFRPDGGGGGCRFRPTGLWVWGPETGQVGCGSVVSPVRARKGPKIYESNNKSPSKLGPSKDTLDIYTGILLPHSLPFPIDPLPNQRRKPSAHQRLLCPPEPHAARPRPAPRRPPSTGCPARRRPCRLQPSSGTTVAQTWRLARCPCPLPVPPVALSLAVCLRPLPHAPAFWRLPQFVCELWFFLGRGQYLLRV